MPDGVQTMSGPCVVGVDGGGSKTLLAAADAQGNVTLWRDGPGTNPFDQPLWRELLTDLLTDLPAGGRAAAAGLAGYGEVPRVSAEQEAAMASLLPVPHTLHNDVHIACDGAFQDRPGVLILSGTGSMAWARRSADDVAPVRVGGWGHDIGDEGSAWWIGLRAISLTTHAMDGRLDAPEFAAGVRAAMGLDGADQAELLEWYHGRPHGRSAVAALAAAVDALAENGDRTAIGLIESAADALCLHVQAAQAQLGVVALPWSHAGGLFASATLRRAMTARLGPPLAPVLPPIGGALWRAARLAGWPGDAAWTARLAHSLAARSALESIPT